MKIIHKKIDRLNDSAVNKNIFNLFFVCLCFILTGNTLFSQTGNIIISNSCVNQSQSLTKGGDVNLTTLNGKPVYYNPSLSVNYNGSITTVECYLYYELASNIDTAEDRWVVSYDGQPFYYNISTSATAPTNTYPAFDTLATAAMCGQSLNFEPCVDPLTYNVTGGGNYCAYETGVAVGLSNSEIGITYQLKVNGNNIGSPVSGTGSAISFGINGTIGTYTVVASGIAGCLNTMNGSVVITKSTAVSGTTVVTNVTCFGGNTGAINLTPSGGTSPYTFNWGGGITTEDRNNIAAGTYSVIITDNKGCTVTVSGITVAQPIAAVSGTTVVTNVNCYSGASGAINLTPTGGTGPYTFNWGGGITSEDRTGLAAGTYSVTITDSKGCTGTVSPTVTQPIAPVSGTTVITNIACYNGSSGAINLTPTGGTGPYTFNWGGGIISEDRTGLAAGTYSVTITDYNYCSTTVSGITISQPTALTVNPSQTNVTCNGGTDGSATVTVSGGTGEYSYSWAPSGGNDATATGLASGSYTVTVTDANFCQTTYGFTITESSAIPAPNVLNNQAFCSGATVADLSMGSPVKQINTNRVVESTYNWYSNETGGEPLASNTILTSGTYYLGITEGTCQSARTAVTVTITPNSTNTTTIKVANSYTWSDTGNTYTTSNIYTGSTTACVTEKLDLTIVNVPAGQIKAVHCGQTLATLNTPIYTNIVVNGIQEFKYEVSEGTTVLQTITSANNYLRLTQITGTTYNKTYSIRVALKIDGVYGDFGTPCSVMTAIPTTQIKAIHCGTTLDALSTVLYADVPLTGIEMYKFEVFKNNTSVGSIENTTNYFRMNQITGVNYNTEYRIKVALKISGTYSAYNESNSCTVTTPAIPTTQIKAVHCGTTLDALSTALYADVPVAGIEMYKFEVFKNNVSIGVKENTANYFRMNQITAVTYNTEYRIKVALKINGIYGAYNESNSCIVTTPAIPTTQIKAVHCGTTLSALNTPLYADVPVTGIEMYKFEVFKNNVSVGTKETTTNYLRLDQITAVTYNTEYRIKVALKISGNYGAYNESNDCIITTPAPPQTQIKAIHCGETLATISTPIYTELVVANIEKFRYEVSDINGKIGEDIETSNNYLRLTQFTAATYNKTYTVKVAIRVKGVWSAYREEGCRITTPNNPNGIVAENNTNSFSRQENPANEDGEIVAKSIILKAYPNPFTNVFKLDYTPLTLGKVTTTVYDLTGKVIETRTFEATQTGTQEFGGNYRAGIYMMNIAQGGNSQNIRIIKQ